MITIDSSVLVPWICERGSALPVVGATSIGWMRDDEIVAGVMYERYTGQSIEASIVVEGGASITRPFLWAMFDYPFNQLNVSKILAYCNSTNAKSIRLLTKLGFYPQALIEDVYEDGDLVIYTMTKQQCEWLEKLHEKGESTQSS